MKLDKQIQLSEQLSALCLPLFNKTAIDFFAYIRNEGTGRVFHLCSNSEWQAYYEKNDFRKLSTLNKPLDADFGKYMMYDSIELSNEDILLSAQEHFGIGNQFVISQKFATHHDFFLFGTIHKPQTIINYYLENIDTLETFLLYFRDKMSNITQARLKNKPKTILEKAKSIAKEYGSSFVAHKFFSQKTKRFYVGCDVYGVQIYLTNRENQILTWKNKNKTAEEIAIILNSKKRTIEKHLENIRKKMDSLVT